MQRLKEGYGHIRGAIGKVLGEKPKEDPYVSPRNPTFEDILGMDDCPTLQRYAHIMQDIAPVVDNIIRGNDLLTSASNNSVRIMGTKTQPARESAYPDSTVALKHTSKDHQITFVSVTINRATRAATRYRDPATALKIQFQTPEGYELLDLFLTRYIQDVDDENRDFFKDMWIIPFFHRTSIHLPVPESDNLVRNHWSRNYNDLIPALATPVTKVIPQIYSRIGGRPDKGNEIWS